MDSTRNVKVAVVMLLVIATYFILSTKEILFAKDINFLYNNANSLCSIDSAAVKVSVLFSDAKLVIHDYSLSPNKEMVAIRGSYAGFDTEKYKKYHFHPKPLIIIDQYGKKLSRIEEVVSYSWSPDSKKIVHIYGKHGVVKDWSVDEFVGVSVWITDVETGEKVNIAQENSTKFFWEVNWALFDGNIYIRLTDILEYGEHHGVFKINPFTGAESPTPYKSINFSPDGKYYFVTSAEADPSYLYLRETNKIVNYIGSGRYDTIFNFLFWYQVRDTTFAQVNDGRSSNYSINCVNGKITMLNKPGNLPKTWDNPVGMEKGNPVWITKNTDGRLKKMVTPSN